MEYFLHDVSEATNSMSSSDWCKGIGLSIFVSFITGASKLAIRKSWLIQHEQEAAAAEAEGQSSYPLLGCEQGTEITSTAYLVSHDGMVDESSGELDDSDDKNCFDFMQDKKQRYFKLNPRALRYAGMFGMTVLNPLCSVFAMNYASPSILAPFSGLALVWVILGAGVYLGEPPSKSQVAATLLIVIGEVVVAIFGDHTNDSGVTVEEVAKSYSSPATISYFACLAVYMLFLWYLVTKSNAPTWQRFAWGSCGGAITGPQNFIKDSLTTLKAVISTPGVKIPWFFPLLIALAIVTSFVGLLLFTAAMKRYNATYCAAAYVGSYVMSASINSIMHYDTFASLPGTWNDIMYPVGLFILMMGVYLLEATGEDAILAEDVEEEVEYILDGITTMILPQVSQEEAIEQALRDCKEVFAYVQLEAQPDDEEEADGERAK
ncbi:unnamed protein product [Cylindrotheca closterium]|uniref:EamA domain-containing protein n=1 Tax=Cylindrotheca closterium TaxID=2856 RepID=A0AAD2CS94_9STRA|nr:unnamed protein product [Cylindrotheca closterium]